MDSSRLLMDVAEHVLQVSTAETALTELSLGLMERTGADRAARVQVQADGRVSWFLHGVSGPAELPSLPPPEELAQHPLHRFHLGPGGGAPALLAEVIRSGFAVPVRTRRIIDQLGLSIHQLSIPVEHPCPETGYQGWVMVGADGLAPDAPLLAREAQGLLCGLDRHIRLLQVLPPGPPTGPMQIRLTPRERAVLLLLATGLTAQGIAVRLTISPRTVHKHQEHLYRRLGAVDRLSAVLRAQEAGLLPAPVGTDVDGVLLTRSHTPPDDPSVRR